MRDVTTFKEAVDAFIESASWLGDADLPGVMTLRKLAEVLDACEATPQAALLSQFNMAFRDLRGREPKADGGTRDPLAAALDAAEQPDLFTAAAEHFHADAA